MADLTTLKTDDIANTVPGAPRRYRIIQDADQLEIRAYTGAGPEDPYLAVVRFLSNQETHLYGECVLWSPAIRHVGVLSLNNVVAGQDIVSFRTGPAAGTEVLRIKSSGAIMAPTTLDLNNSGSGDIVSFRTGAAPGTEVLSISSGGSVQRSTTLALNNTGSGDIVSFRTGTAPGTEVLSIDVGGAIVVPTRTGYASLHASGFFRNTTGSTNAASGLVVSGTSYETAYLATTVPAASQGFCAGFPPGIPAGATVTSMRMLYEVVNTGASPNEAVIVDFYKTRITDNAGTSIKTLTSGAGTGAPATVDGSLGTPEVIDLATYCYGVRVTLINGTSSTSRFHALRFTYTYTKVGG